MSQDMPIITKPVITVAEVRKVREDKGCGLLEAKRFVEHKKYHQKMCEAIQEATTVPELKSLLLAMLEHYEAD